MVEHDWIGKVCWFWSDFRPNEKILGILIAVGPDGYYDNTDIRYDHCAPVRPDEIQFYTDTTGTKKQ